jgi:hypothetical protein
MRLAGTVAVLAVAILGVPGLNAAQAPPAQTPPAASSTPSAADAAIEQLRKDARTDRTQIISAAMGFTADENAAFWPLYKKYEQVLKSIGDEKVAAIKDYAANYDSMTDAKAKELVGKYQVIEDKQMAARRDFVKSIEGVLPAKKVARYYQVEGRLQMLFDLALASEIPLIK